jgi:hypothetical protein
MDYVLQNLIVSLPEMAANFWNSSFVLALKIFLGVYLVVIFADIILLLILRNIPQHLRVGMRGMDIPTVTRNKMNKRWKSKVGKLLANGNQVNYKLAIIEADAIADEILDGIGYKGSNMVEKLEQVGDTHLDDHLESLKGVHQIRNRIVHEPDFEVDERFAKTVVGVYENFLRYLELLD